MSATLEPHAYEPDATYMGDCRVCGHQQNSPMNTAFKQDLHLRPVAFRLFYRETWLIFQDEQTAAEVADSVGVKYQGLYVRDGK
jgi:hypothetical protein